jgi:hypothetical protein
MRLFRSVLGKGVMYAGSVRDIPGKIASPGSMKSKSFGKKSLLSFSLLLMTGLNVLTPASGLCL